MSQDISSSTRVDRVGALFARRRAGWAVVLPRQNLAVLRSAFAALALLGDVAAIMFSVFVAGFAYHWFVYDVRGMAESFLRLGLLISLLIVAPNLMQDDYAIARYLTFKGRLRRVLLMWNVAFVSALAIGFVTKTTAEFSRGTVILFYFVGLAALTGVRALLVKSVRSGGRSGVVASRRVFLVGREPQIEDFLRRFDPHKLGLRVVAASYLRETPETLRDDLALAAASARMLRPDDVFILTPWSQRDLIEACVDAFMRVPSAIHLGPERVLDRFEDAHISKIGGISSLFLVRRPLNTAEVLLKRAIDVAGSLVALALIAPFLAVVALLIKLDSPGPVFFAQRRYGFNQEPFRILKFRSMSTLEDGRVIPQVSGDDPRVTRVGRWLRRYSIDELPQLLNVLRGDMSLVGPRPHALAHDQAFEQKIALYARRHNVRPGITGWAQVNGLRGETSTDAKMRARVEHDLYYIDNWSPLFDLQIMFLTVFSAKTYRNAR